MKRFSKYLIEGCTTSDVNPGNTYSNTGVSNHLTPVGNIVTQIRNIFAPVTGIVASVGEDGFSVKLNSSKFVSKDAVNSTLYDSTIMRGTSLAGYVISQGLETMKVVPVGQFFVVYFCPSDIKASNPGQEPEPSKFPCTEMRQYGIDEAEMFSLITESDEEEEMEDITHKKIIELIDSKDKVKAAKQFELMVAQEVELPRDYYFAGVKDADGDESIALRWKYTKKRAHNKTTQITRSLINIYDSSKDGVWVQDFDKEAYFKIPEEVEKLINTILEFIGAKKTNNPCIWSLEGSKDDKDDDKDKDEDKDEDNKDEKKDQGDDLLNSRSDEKDSEDNKEDSKEDSDEKSDEKSSVRLSL